MPDGIYWIVLLVLVAGLVYGAFLLGRATALNEVRRQQPTPAGDAGETNQPQPRREPPRTGAAPPPASAGGGTGPATSGTTPIRRSAAPPPAAAAGSGPTANAGASSVPRRSAAPPPAAAAWSNDGDDKKGR